MEGGGREAVEGEVELSISDSTEARRMLNLDDVTFMVLWSINMSTAVDIRERKNPDVIAVKTPLWKS